jgi:glycosyltransferase involved in cell wall biosynthesis
VGAMRVCAVIPMYNEATIARQSIETILNYTKKLLLPFDLIVVNDGSQDITGDILKDLLNKHNGDGFKVISHPKNQGYGAAIKTGIEFAIENNYDYALFMDSDLTNHPQYLKDFRKKMDEGWDYIKATRYSKGGRVEGVPWCRRIISFLGNIAARVLYGLPLTDITNGFRAVKVNILKQINFTEKGFVIIMEELYQAKFLTDSFCEIPYTLTSRKLGQGKTRFSYGPKTCLLYLKYAVKSFLRRH